MTQQGKSPDYGQNLGLEFLGIPGTNGPDPRQSGMPGFTLTGYSTFGNTDSPRPNFYADQSYTSSHNASYSMGKHELRFGFDMVRHQLNHWQPELNNPRGGFTFGGAVTALSRRRPRPTSSTAMRRSCWGCRRMPGRACNTSR